MPVCMYIRQYELDGTRQQAVDVHDAAFKTLSNVVMTLTFYLLI